MRAVIKNCIFFGIMVCLLASSANAQVSVKAQVDTSRKIYVGQSFAYSVVIEGSDEQGQVDIESLRRFDPQGPSVSQQSSINIVGKRTVRTATYALNYSLTCWQEGAVTIEPVTVTIKGNSYATEPIRLSVTMPDSTDKIKVDMKLSENTCYVGQPVTMDVELVIFTNVKNASFNVPVFNTGDFYFEDPANMPKALAQGEHTIGGVNVLLQERRDQVRGAETASLSFQKVLIPKRSGRIEIQPSAVSLDVVVGRSQGVFGPRFDYDRFIAFSKPLTLDVLPLPPQEKPPGFYGLVGDYELTATATPTEVNVGEPITLTIMIGGNDYLEPIQWPKLEDIPEMAANFKIPLEKSSPVIKNGCKVFTQTIRANSDKVTQIPPIPLPLFDSEKGSYTVKYSRPIALTVAPTKVLTGKDFLGGDFGPVNKEVEAVKKGISANYEGPDVFRNMSFSLASAIWSPGYATIWALPFAVMVLSAAVRILTHTTPQKQAVRRARRACPCAIGSLNSITSADPGHRHDLLASAMKQYIGDRFGKVAGSLTGQNCREIIASTANDEQAARKYQEIIADCEEARYGSAQTNIDDELVKEVTGLIRDIEKKSRK